jgi:hypothetical protein
MKAHSKCGMMRCLYFLMLMLVTTQSRDAKVNSTQVYFIVPKKPKITPAPQKNKAKSSKYLHI